MMAKDALKFGISKIGRKILSKSPKAVQRAYKKYLASDTESGKKIRKAMKSTYKFMKKYSKEIKATVKLLKSKKLKANFKRFKQLIKSKKLRTYLRRGGVKRFMKEIKNNRMAKKLIKTFKKKLEAKAKSWIKKQG